MKKISTATAHAIRKVESERLTIGLDLGDRSSWYCVLDETGEVLLEQKLSTIPKTMREVFGAMPHSRIALETGMHSPWVSRLLSGLGHEVIVAHARNVRLIGESRGRPTGCADSGAAGPDRSAVAMSGEASQRKSAGGSDGDPGTSWSGASADRAGQHGTRTGQELRGAVARVQCAEYESRESGRLESGTAMRTAAVAGGNRIAERADPRVQRTDRKAGAIKLSPGGAAKADQGSRSEERRVG